MLNAIWIMFFMIAFICAGYQSFILGDVGIWHSLISASFSSAKSAFEICLNLTGIMCLWLGLLKIAEASGLATLLTKLLQPLFRRIMPDVPDNSPALASIMMNIATNMLGLDNAATPMGIKAMEQLQEINPTPQIASKAQQLFLVINASAVTIIPITILMYRSELGSLNPAAVFIPILLATSVSTLVGFLSIAYVQKLNIFNLVVMGYVGGAVAFIAAIACYFSALPDDIRVLQSTAVGNFILFLFMVSFIFYGFIRKVNVYDKFIKGAKEGFAVAIKIIPYLVAMLVAISVFRASGALDWLVAGIEQLFDCLGINTDFVKALPTAFLKPLSGSGARAMMIETMQRYGADSFTGYVSSVVQGSTETTFYVLALYFGAVGISKVGAALPCALLADLAGIVAAVYFSYIFY
ncbi:MAG: spore maturation protein [Alphaproteobacteria bacterium]|nr:spore maturation protein [Alphaproteobacteria bacterium]